MPLMNAAIAMPEHVPIIEIKTFNIDERKVNSFFMC
jgi:hypothetical protein